MVTSSQARWPASLRGRLADISEGRIDRQLGEKTRTQTGDVSAGARAEHDDVEVLTLLLRGRFLSTA